VVDVDDLFRKTELWVDLLIESHQTTTTKDFRYLFAVRGPHYCDYHGSELKTSGLSTRVLELMDLDLTAQLVVIPHSSGGAVCGGFLSQLHRADTATGHTPSVNGRVTYLILDADASIVPTLNAAGFFHASGLYGIGARATDLNNRMSHNSFIADYVGHNGGTSKIYDVSGTHCPARDPGDAHYCVHQAVQCINPGEVHSNENCPSDLAHLESRFLDLIPF